MDYIHLQGAEQVQSAGRTISGAADEMQRAAANMEGALERHQRFLDDWLSRLQAVIEDSVKPPDMIMTTNDVLCLKPIDGDICALKMNHVGNCLSFDDLPF